MEVLTTVKALNLVHLVQKSDLLTLLILLLLVAQISLSLCLSLGDATNDILLDLLLFVSLNLLNLLETSSVVDPLALEGLVS